MLWAAGVLPMGLALGLHCAQGDSKCISPHVEAVPHSLFLWGTCGDQTENDLCRCFED